MSYIFNVEVLPSVLFAVIRITTPLIFATLGAIISKKAGFNNLALESMMLTAAFTAVLASAAANNCWIGLLGGIAGALFISLIIIFSVLKLKTDLYLTCLSLNMMASYGTTFCMYVLCESKITTAWALASVDLPNINIPIIKDIPFIGEIISGHNILTYVSLLAIIIMHILLNNTRIGLRIRAVGENEKAAESVGVNVIRVKAISFIISGLFAALGGIFMSLGYVSWFNKDMLAGRGFIGNASSTLSNAEPALGALYSLLFGITQSIGNILIANTTSIPSELVLMFPYVVTVVMLAVSNYVRIRKEQKKANMQ